MNKYNLKHALTVNGKELKELTYDVEGITCDLYTAAFTRRSAGTLDKQGIIIQEFDVPLHLYMGFAAIIAANPDIDWEDLKRVKGADAVGISAIGRGFFLGQSTQSEDSQA